MDGILMTPGDIAREHVTTVGYSLSVLLSPVKWTLPPGRPAYEYINNGNVMTWKVMSNLTVFAFRMTLPRGKHRFYIYNISVEYIFILSKIFWLI